MFVRHQCGGDEKGSLKSGTVKHSRESQGTRTRDATMTSTLTCSLETHVEAGSNTCTVALVVKGDGKGTQCLGDILVNTGTWPSRLGQSRV
jgi:hypothetical protein